MSDTESTLKNRPAAQLASEKIVQEAELAGLEGLRNTKIPLNNGSDEIPALGFGTLIPDPIATKEATRTALEVGFRQFDCAERYRNEEHVGEAMRGVFREGKVRREDVFVGTKLWRPLGTAEWSPLGHRHRARLRPNIRRIQQNPSGRDCGNRTHTVWAGRLERSTRRAGSAPVVAQQSRGPCPRIA